ncbi:hypothetical protein ACFWBF_11040 [Streptomyces sp. NPDC060028]|uniref:hypothetical protein n=1 Tax=Streptomyces sp. NPDC060028 TaxID=3347041 RepID=UPI0036BD67B6
MAEEEKGGKDRADQLHEVIDQLAAGAASPDAPAPTGPRGESLREAVHRRMRELHALSEEKQEKSASDTETL